MNQPLLEYVTEACQKRFGHELIEVKVRFSVPQQAFVQLEVNTVTPEIIAFALDLQQEFAELGRHVDVQAVVGG